MIVNDILVLALMYLVLYGDCLTSAIHASVSNLHHVKCLGNMKYLKY